MQVARQPLIPCGDPPEVLQPVEGALGPGLGQEGAWLDKGPHLPVSSILFLRSVA